MNQLRDEPKGKYRNIHKEISSKMVAMGYAKPDAKIQINENFVTRVKKIMGDTYLNKGRILTKGQSQQLNFLIAQGNENDSRKKSSIGTSEIIVEDMHFEKTP